MSMEEEVIPLLRTGFIAVMGIVVIIVITLMVKYRKRGFGWFLAHLLLFSWGALGWIRILETRATASSIDNSLTIAWIGIIWMLSMVCFVKGLLFLIPKTEKNELHIKEKSY
ncbi:hypothetical protein [Paenibacillus sp. Soil750]|uniref:hypothetical protein n=1 Tax=Paenibacillus sp. Soil750 TaxID=1736398 RepID=UPI0006F21099|nr:hypothetical protein [Paenibacillus sp. Soil750]KRE70834.1 hypothetical protein ASL11_11105 [Paenibacillus sp. Soil750]